ncbi:MAG: hypothetical protein ABSA59_03435, partial [Terriglobia bacterium]
RFSKFLTKGKILCLRRFTLTRLRAGQQRDAKMPISPAKCMKTIPNNLEMRMAFQAISLKINVLQANRASICGKSWAFADYPL